MELIKAMNAQAILNKIECLKRNIKYMTEDNTILCFAHHRPCDADVIASPGGYYNYKSILDRHHEEIIQELKDEIAELEKQIEEL